MGLVVESLALTESDVATGQLCMVHDSRDTLPAYFMVTLPGPQRTPVRAFLRWLAANA